MNPLTKFVNNIKNYLSVGTSVPSGEPKRRTRHQHKRRDTTKPTKAMVNTLQCVWQTSRNAENNIVDGWEIKTRKDLTAYINSLYNMDKDYTSITRYLRMSPSEIEQLEEGEEPLKIITYVQPMLPGMDDIAA